ncbi:MAG TPA: PIG-L family deacetylase [Longimicrobiales bacterium]
MVAANDMRQAARLAALETELQLLGGSGAPWQAPGMARWFNAKFKNQAPAAIIRRKAGRYRMPRRLKHELIERFCAVADPVGAITPSVMIVAAHQDDESIGAGARLCRLTDAWVVHVTDGAPRDPSVAERYGFSSRDEYASVRRQELLRAMEIAGVPQERLICLEYVDGEAAFRMVDLVLDVARLIDDYEPDIIITHPYEGGHTDHDATAFAVHLACGLLRREGRDAPAVLEMTSYHSRDGQRVVHEFLPHERADLDRRLISLSEPEQKRKQDMYKCFTTQQGVLSTFDTAIEKFRPAPRYVFTRAPHEGRLNYEKYGDARLGERWRANAAAALSRLRLRKA